MIPNKQPLSALTTREAIGQRLRNTRAALDLRHIDVCRATGINSNAYSQYEHGKRFPNVPDMIRYAEALGVTLDWIYRGDTSGLPYHLARKLIQPG